MKKAYGSTMEIFCDWGSSNLRACLVDGGRVLERYESELGIKNIRGNKDRYPAELEKLVSRFGGGPFSAIQLSGMVGSKNGWVDAGYADTPAGPGDVASGLVRPPEFPQARIIPGLRHVRDDGSIDLMRGEEVQVFGLLSIKPEAEKICLPGTHSKWVDMEKGKIRAFKSYLTGDLFSSLCEHSIFREQIGSREFDEKSFVEGCDLARNGSTLDDLFRLRSDYVCSKVSGKGFYSYLSGFLIGNEIRAEGASGTVYLCGSETLRRCYSMALARFSVESIPVESEAATIAGHSKLGNWKSPEMIGQ